MADRKLRAEPGDRQRRTRRAKPPPRPKGRRRRAALKFTVLAALWASILGGAALGYFILTLPDTGDLTHAARRQSITVLAADGSVLATYGDLFGEPLSLRQMSRYLPEAVIATEDRRFYSHFGVDPWGLLRAAFADLSAGHIVEGGSTITQQLAKNLFLTPERNLGRKVRETLLALWLEHRFTKNQILEIYLNRIYLGAGTYGVDAAAHRYFGVSARRLDLYQSAVIAGLLKAPTRFNPLRDRELAEARAAQVLDNMVEAGFITRAAADTAEREEASLPAVPVRHSGVRYFTDWIVDRLGDFAGIGDRDLVVVTTLDPRLQALAEDAINQTIARRGKKAAVGEGALVAMSPDGAVRAMVGGRDYSESQFNRATRARRQPGSAFKPFVYLAGLEAGLAPSDHFVDEPIRIGGWQPRDYDNRYRGDMTMAQALAQSVNTVAVRVALRAGIDNVIAVAHRLGITAPLVHDASIALGTDGVNLTELVSAYVPFANGGYGVWPYGIAVIRDPGDRVLFRHRGSGPGRVVAPQLVGEMNAMLSRVLTDGTGRNAALPRPAAGKTGTTQDYRDAWFIGYTAGLVAGVWFGNDDNAPMNGVTGGSLPALAWRNFMLPATNAMPVRPLPSAPAAAVVAEAPTPGLFDGFFGLFRSRREPAPPPAARGVGG